MNSLFSRLSQLGYVLLGVALLPALAGGQNAPSTRNNGFATPDQAPKLISVLQQTGASQFDKARACQQLADIGGPEAVSALAAWLGDEHLGYYARSGLERIPDASAAAALREALGRLQGKLLIGVVNSLGARRDPMAVEALRKLARDPASRATAEALLAMGRIATPEAIEALQQALSSGPEELRPTAAEGCLFGAETLLKSGNRAQAIILYDLVRQTALGQLRLAATRGAILARRADGLTLLLEQLRSSDPAMVGVALGTIRDSAVPEVISAVATELPKAQSAMQVLLVKALANHSDPKVATAIEPLADSTAPEVRLAVLEALGKIGSATSIPVFLKALASNPSGTEAGLASASLVKNLAPGTDAALLKNLPSSPPALRARLIGILGLRQAGAATSELLQQAGDSDMAVAKAAFTALAFTASPRDLPRLIALTVACQDSSLRESAERSVLAVCLKNPDVAGRGNFLVSAYQASRDTAAKCSILRMLGMLGDYRACQWISSVQNDPSPEIRETAFRLLADWPDATPVARLLAVAKTTPNEMRRTLALRGVIRLATMVADDYPRAPRHVVDWLTEANQLIRPTIDEKRLILSGLAKLRCVEGLQLLQPYLADPEAPMEAAQALIQTAQQMPPSEARLMAKSLIEKLIATTKKPDVRSLAEAALQQIPGKSLELKVPSRENRDLDISKLSFRPMFDGKTFNGWNGETYKSFRIEKGVIIGGNLKNRIPQNEFLCTTRPYADFVLRVECKLTRANAGIQFRSQRATGSSEVSGYQADMDTSGAYWGCLYDESRRGMLVKADESAVAKIVKRDDWNLYEIRCQGPHIQLFVNGVQTVDYLEKDPLIGQSGLIGLQIHGGEPGEAWYRNPMIAELP